MMDTKDAYNEPIGEQEYITGLDIMRAIRDGHLPPPPIAGLIGLKCISAEMAEIKMQLHYHKSLENSSKMLHGGVIATIFDTAMGAAAFTKTPASTTLVTFDLSITYLHAVRPENSPVTVVANLINSGSRFKYVTADMHDNNGRLVAQATGKFVTIGDRPSFNSD